MKILVADYILKRIKELGIQHVFGVPGDYNLRFLDHIEKDSELEWIGNCNELNGGYAADGYARIRGVSAILTTFGVGELSAMNALAGAYAEYIPIIHLVGMPGRAIQKSKAVMHHSLGDGDFSVFRRMYRDITCASTILDEHHISFELDRVMKALLLYKRPIYIGIPDDLVEKEIEIEDKPIIFDCPKTDSVLCNELTLRLSTLINQARSPIILVDILSERFNMTSLVRDFIEKSNIPFCALDLGKSLIDETHPLYLGQFRGALTDKTLLERIEGSDCVIWFGALLTDFNTGGFSAKINARSLIQIQHNQINIHHANYQEAYFNDYVSQLLPKISKREMTIKKNTPVSLSLTLEGEITQKHFWAMIKSFLKEESIVLSDFGTSIFGTLTMQFPKETTYITQLLWGSIGYSLGALLGASLASKDKQCILFIGDGAFQLTAQAVSTMMRHKLNPIIFLINNDGYTVERALHEPNMKYNDINQWHYAELPKTFGDEVWTAKVSTKKALDEALSTLHQCKDKLRFIEVVMKKEDMPDMLKTVGKMSKL
jgi:TPP-dependent 2-oxoacid decarboxylase